MLEVQSGNATHLKVELYYSKGGMNYFTYNNEQRGLYLSVSPVTISKGDGYNTESYYGFSGIKQFVQEMKKFSEKTLENFVIQENLLKNMIDIVIAKNGIVLKES